MDSSVRAGKNLAVSGWPWFVLCGVLACFGCTLAEGDAESTPTNPQAAKRRENRLARETSPYLLAHAHNPVDWYPWGPEALEKARKEDKPIFLSIGYSACHWCHVMEKKVFSDPEIARYMNEHFVCIKVDREERPDLDDIYMTALQMYYQATGSPETGGWPLSMFLTPDGRPLGGGTYFGPRDEEERTGFPTLMKRVAESWRDDRKKMETNADILARAVRAASRPQLNLKPVKLDHELLAPVLEKLTESFDPEYGGFGYDARNPHRAKFPVPTKLAFLQYETRRHNHEQAGKMLALTLDRMAAGGIYDHVGGGFHRYSTDRFWRVPHFEKMLYDNAQLADLYLEAYRRTNDRHYRAVTEETLDFVLRDLTDPQGAFYSSLDADSEGIEGKYYVWTNSELAAALSQDDFSLCRTIFGIGDTPNFEIGHVLEMPLSLDEAAKELKLSAVNLEKRLGEIKQKLLTVRQRRRAPPRDDKILTSWNGLMIHALARAGVILQRPEYIKAGEKAANFVLTEMRDEKGRLFRSYRSKQAKLPGYLDDYAFLIDGLLALNLATNDDRWVNAARRLSDLQLQLFWDEKGKGFYFTAHDHETLLARTKNAYDSVLPSGNSVAARNLIRLSSLTKQSDYREKSRECLETFAPAIEGSPTGLTGMALAIVEFLDTNAPQTSQLTGTKSSRPRTGIAPDLGEDSGSGIVQAGGEKPAAPPGKKKPEILEAEVYFSTDRLPAGATSRVALELKIADSWHIQANPVGDEDLDFATEISLESDDGVELAKLRYPQGQTEERGAGEKPQLVYSKRVFVQGLLNVPAEAAGKRGVLTFSIAYQACNGGKCLAPKTLTVPVGVTFARPGEQVKPINAKLFVPPAKKRPDN